MALVKPEEGCLGFPQSAETSKGRYFLPLAQQFARRSKRLEQFWPKAFILPAIPAAALKRSIQGINTGAVRL